MVKGSEPSKFEHEGHFTRRIHGVWLSTLVSLKFVYRSNIL